jgi:hypothetical protein
MEKQIKVIIVEPHRPARIEIIANNLEAKQKIVGGYIECVRFDGFDIIINEEGKLENLEPNFSIYDGMDYIAGTAIFAGVDYDRGEFKSLTAKQQALILMNFSGRKTTNDKTN